MKWDYIVVSLCLIIPCIGISALVANVTKISVEANMIGIVVVGVILAVSLTMFFGHFINPIF